MFVGAAIAAWALAIAAFAIVIAAISEPELSTFIAWCISAIAICLAVLFIYWTYSLASLRYLVDRDAVTIRWGFHQVVVPIDAVIRLVPGRTIDPTRVSGLNWWGCHIGTADVKRVGYTLFYSTHSHADEILYLVTREESYALTVPDQAAFAEEIQDRAAMGPLRHVDHRSRVTGVAALPFFHDRLAMATAAFGVIPAVALCGYLFWAYPGLPNVIQIAFPSLGSVVRVGDKSALLKIAYLGLAILAMNSLLGVILHTRERAAGIWLFSAGGLLQSILLGAAVVAIQRS